MADKANITPAVDANQAEHTSCALHVFVAAKAVHQRAKRAKCQRKIVAHAATIFEFGMQRR